ncbi:hypothetical protein EMCRGX_G035075 [Ephydatia muelleri]
MDELGNDALKLSMNSDIACSVGEMGIIIVLVLGSGDGKGKLYGEFHIILLLLLVHLFDEVIRDGVESSFPKQTAT